MSRAQRLRGAHLAASRTSSARAPPRAISLRHRLQCSRAPHKTTAVSRKTHVRAVTRERAFGRRCGQEAYALRRRLWGTTIRTGRWLVLKQTCVFDSAMPLKPNNAKPCARACRWRRDVARSIHPLPVTCRPRDKWKGPLPLSPVPFGLRSSGDAPGAGPRHTWFGRMRHPPFGCCA